MNTAGIRQRLMLLALLPGAIIGLALYSYFVNNQLQQLEQALHEHGRTMAHQLAPASEYGVITGNTEFLARLTTVLLDQRDVVGIALNDFRGGSIFHVGQVHNYNIEWAVGNSREPVALCHEEKTHLVFCAPIRLTRLQVSDFPDAELDAGEAPLLGYVQVEISKAAMLKRRDELIGRALGITLVVLFVTSLFAAYVGYRISGPIVAMTEAVSEVGKGNLDVRMWPYRGGEIGALSQGINEMIDSLRVARDELRSQVDAATEQLRLTLRELEEKNEILEQQRQHAQAASLAKGQFLANMSHEIRTPLSGIIGMLELLEKTELQPVQQTYVMNLTLAARALHGLLNDILDLSRIEAGKLQLLEQWFNPQEVLAEVVMMLAPSAHEKSLDLIYHPLPGFPARVRGDSLRLRQVLINLISNAIKFTEAGRIVVRAMALARQEDGRLRVRIEIEDTGIGIPVDKQRQVFDSFTQIDASNTRKYGGSGLGTTISRELVHLMRGTIGLRSAEGAGSCFWFEIPWQFEDVAQAQAAPWQGQRLLIADRSAAERRALVDIAQSIGLTAVGVADEAGVRTVLAGSDALAAVLLVENAPQASWLALAQELRRQSVPNLCHVTFFNGQTDFTLFDAYLNKPVTAEVLREAMLGMQRDTSRSVAVLPDKAGRDSWRVLVAEDNHINALVIKSFLDLSGHQVLCVDDGVEALDALEHESFDIVFMDMRMPRMDGLEATRRWRAREETGVHLPIIALTANATVEDREQCLAAGMDDFLAKPVSPAQLLEALQRLQHKTN